MPDVREEHPEDESLPTTSAVRPASMRKKALPRTRKHLFAKILLLCVSSVVSLFILEAACRFLGYRPMGIPVVRDHSFLHSEPFLREAQLKGWIHWPSTDDLVTIDEHPSGGVRIRRNGCSFREDAETPIAKPKNTYRILVTGDSHTDGVVDNRDNYPNVLESLMNSSESEQHVDVINAGFGVFSPYQELWAYEKVFHEFSPDLLVVGFYTGNDIWDLTWTDRVHLKKVGNEFVHVPKPDATGAEAVDSSESTIRRMKNFFRDRTATYHALVDIRWLRSAFGTPPPPPDQFQSEIDQVAEVSPPAYWQGLGQAHYFRHHPSRWNECHDMMRHVMTELLKSTNRNDTDLLFLIIPTLRETHPHTDAESIRDAKSVLGLSDDDMATDVRAGDMVVEIAEELGIEVLDLRDAFGRAYQENGNQALYWQFDHHINVAGHALVAHEMHEYLEGAKQ